jgi:hypothetical protein
MVDLLIVLENVGIVQKVRKNCCRFIGMNNLFVDHSLKLQNCVRLATLTRVFFRHLIERGTIDTVLLTLRHLSGNERHWAKMNRRLYDIINVFEGAGIVQRDWKVVQCRVGQNEPMDPMLPLDPIFVSNAGSASRCIHEY